MSGTLNKVMLYKQAVKEFVPVEVLGQMAVFMASESATTLTGTGYFVFEYTGSATITTTVQIDDIVIN